MLLSGKLRGTPEVRQSRKARPFVTFRLNVPTGTVGGYTLASCISFSQTVVDVVSALIEGDSLSVNGEAALKSWEGQTGTNTGLDVTVHGVLTAYHLGRKRDAMAQAQASHQKRHAAPDEAAHWPEATPAPTRPKFHHPDFQQPDLSETDPDGWGSLDGV